ncbi:DNA internalization-related competence protein ComEC/Rec2 [Shewanella sp. VB17]|uniref:DNA internalization-related competence protein ComEC/Rec2 n=1 Tax=Shewanella sp. VB17 TaxID=2739432 RepID=UPI0028155214|nr:DNA internalization-related competence protein ComEC/Rec2 [Shewanella sp. VB17]
MFGFSATIILTMLWPSLPSMFLALILVAIGCLLLIRSPLLSGAVLGVAWISIYAQLMLSWERENIDREHSITGEIISLVNQNSDWVSMDFRLLNHHSTRLLPKILRLSWKTPPSLQIGEIWELRVIPKPITNVLNQGGYNQQKGLISRHIVSKGKVVFGQRIETSYSFRHAILLALKPALDTFDNGDLILALLLGDRSLIGTERWHSLRVTGAGHLVAISGLHLSVVAAWVFISSFTFLGRVSVPLGRRNLLLAAILSAMACSVYAYLAGFSLPTQRALVMLLLLMLLTMLNRYSSSWERLLFALFFLLMIDPLSCLSAGFWLSFTALSIILLTLQCRSPKDNPACRQSHLRVFMQRLGLFWAIQWRLSLVLGLLQSIFFGGLTFYGVLFNFFFVPWFSLVVIPAAMLTFIVWLLCWSVGFDVSPLFYLVDVTLWPMDKLLTFFVTLPGAWFPISEVMILAMSFFMLGLSLIMTAKKLEWRLMMSILLLPSMITLCFQYFSVSQGTWQVHLLDVGQGLSVVVEKGQHGFVYDTGAKYGENFSYADRVVVPFLHARGIKQLDYLVLSHSDNDHAGGASELINAFPKVKVVSDISQYSDLSCRPKVLIWKGLEVEVLAPEMAEKGNDGSCVIKISDKFHQVLLTGDIEKLAEQRLLDLGDKLKSDVLIAPHHGSRTSSTPNFIKQVSADLVLFPAGFNNRYGFPKSDVVHRYVKHGSDYLIAGREGQISVIFNREKRFVRTYRTDLAPFWYNRLFEFGKNGNPE